MIYGSTHTPPPQNTQIRIHAACPHSFSLLIFEEVSLSLVWVSGKAGGLGEERKGSGRLQWGKRPRRSLKGLLLMRRKGLERSMQEKEWSWRHQWEQGNGSGNRIWPSRSREQAVTQTGGSTLDAADSWGQQGVRGGWGWLVLGCLAVCLVITSHGMLHSSRFGSVQFGCLLDPSWYWHGSWSYRCIYLFIGNFLSSCGNCSVVLLWLLRPIFFDMGEKSSSPLSP